MGVDLDKWIEKVKKTEYLAEDELKALCEYVSSSLAIAVDPTYCSTSCSTIHSVKKSRV